MYYVPIACSFTPVVASLAYICSYKNSDHWKWFRVSLNYSIKRRGQWFPLRVCESSDTKIFDYELTQIEFTVIPHSLWRWLLCSDTKHRFQGNIFLVSTLSSRTEREGNRVDKSEKTGEITNPPGTFQSCSSWNINDSASFCSQLFSLLMRTRETQIWNCVFFMKPVSKKLFEALRCNDPSGRPEGGR